MTSGIRLGTPAATTPRLRAERSSARSAQLIVRRARRARGQCATTTARSKHGCARRCASCAGGSRSIGIADRSRAGRRGRPACAVRSAETTIPRSRTSRPTDDNAAIRRRRQCPNCGGALHHLRARAAARAVGGEEATASASRSTARSWCARCRSRCASGRSTRSGWSAWSTASCGAWKARARPRSRPTRSAKLVMEALATLDKVAYVRFASVYRNFREAKDFEDLRRQARQLTPTDGQLRADRSPTHMARRAGAGARAASAACGPTRRWAASSSRGRRTSSAAAGRSPAAGRMPRPRRWRAPASGARRHRLCHARTLRASRPDAALRRGADRGRHRARGRRRRGPRPARLRARLRAAARGRHRGRSRRAGRGGAASSTPAS